MYTDIDRLCEKLGTTVEYLMPRLIKHVQYRETAIVVLSILVCVLSLVVAKAFYTRACTWAE